MDKILALYFAGLCKTLITKSSNSVQDISFISVEWLKNYTEDSPK